MANTITQIWETTAACINTSTLYDVVLYPSAGIAGCLSVANRHRPNGFTDVTPAKVLLFDLQRSQRHLWKRLGYRMQIASFFLAGLPLLWPALCSSRPVEKDLNNLRQYMRASAWMVFATHFTKVISRRRRPDAAQFDSFPSGHTMATAVNMMFAAHTLADVLQNRGMKKETAETISYGAAGIYTLAVGLSRVLCQRHTVADVAMGLFLGTAIGLAHLPFLQSSRDEPTVI